MEGRRPLLTEVQALVVPSSAPAPRRVTNGIEGSRVAMLLAVPFGMAFVVAAGYAAGTIAGTAARPAGRTLVPAAGVRLLLALVCGVAVGVSTTISIGAS